MVAEGIRTVSYFECITLIGGIASDFIHRKFGKLVAVGAVDLDFQIIGEVGSLNHHIEGNGFAQSHFAEVDGAAHRGIYQLGVTRNLATTLFEHLTLLIAPDILFEAGDVDKRVAIVLYKEYSLVAVDFLIAHGILACPLQKQGISPLRQSEVAAIGEHIGVFPSIVLIHGSHIEIGAGEVAFIFIGRLEHRLASATHTALWSSHLAHAVVKRCHLNHAQRIIVFRRIGFGIRWVKVIDIGISLILVAAPPTFWARVLAI